MIDFKNGAYFKLKKTENEKSKELVSGLLISGEEVICTFKAIRDEVVFTNKRIIAINIQGLTGSKKDFSILPYSKIQAFSVETASFSEILTGAVDSELELYFSGLGKVKFDFTSDTDIKQIGKMISEYVL